MRETTRDVSGREDVTKHVNRIVRFIFSVPYTI